MGRLIDILIRIVVFRERLEKASPEEIRTRLGLLSSLCTLGLIFFHCFKLLEPVINRLRDTTVFILMISVIALLFFGTFAGFYRLNVKYSIIVSISLLFWVIAEIIYRTINFIS